MKETFQSIQKIVTDAATEIGLTINQSNVLTSTDTDARQLAQFVVSTAEELLTKFPWRSYIGEDPWVMSNTSEYKYEIEVDTDVPQIDSRVLKLGARWRYLHAKGLTYDEDFRMYQTRVQSFAYNKNKQRTINMNQEVLET